MTLSELQSRVQNAKALDFGDIFNKSIELFKKVWVQGLVMILLTIAMLIPFYIIMYLPLLAMGILDSSSTEFGQDWDVYVSVPFIFLAVFVSFFAMVIGFGMKAAFYRICRIKDLNEAKPDDYFYFLKRPYLGKVIQLALITFGISILATLLCVLPVIYVAIPITLMNVIFALNPELSPSEIVKAGFELGNKKWFITFGLLFVSGILAEIVGMLLCFIGILATASFSYIPAYFIYKESVGFEDSVEISEIEQI